MGVSALGSFSHAAMTAGLRGEFRAITMRGAFGSAGLIDPTLDASLTALETAARGLTRAGAGNLGNDLLGTLFDVLG